MALLRVLSGEQSGDTLELAGNAVVIGRHPTCDIRITDDTVSRRHACILEQDDGYYVDGRKLANSVRLSNLDKINIFDTTVEFRDDGENGPADSDGNKTIDISA